MNFVFINPPREIASSNVWRIINSKMPPLGIALLSAIWDEQGHTSQIIDAATLQLTVPEILAAINRPADFVGITATTPEILTAIKIAEGVRKKIPEAKIIMGGVHPTLFHKELVESNLCDIVVRNEGEIPVTELAKGTPLNLIPNLTWRNSQNEVVVNNDAAKHADLDGLPFPAYHKLPMHLYHSALGAARKSPSIGMVTSRGCPGKCTFCFSEMFGSQTRFMSPDRIIQHIEHLQKNYGIREISFYDDTFTANNKNVTELCNLILDKKIRLSWSCFARVDTVTPELLLFMKKAGCHQIMYGFESVDEKILKNINKRTTLGLFQNVVTWTKAAKIDIRGAFMLGNPGETAAGMEKTLDFAKKAGIHLAVFNITTPYPGTRIYQEYSKKNLILHHNWNLYNLAEPVLQLDTVSAETIRKYYYRSYREFYLRPFFIIRHILAIRSFAEFKIYATAALRMIALLLTNIFQTKAPKKFQIDSISFSLLKKENKTVPK